MLVVIGVAASQAAAGGCPSLIRVPEDAASINDAVAMVCANTSAEIVLGPGTWAARILSASQSSIVIRGSGIATCTVVPVVSGEGVIANGHWDFARIRFADLSLNGVGGSNLRTTFTGCRVVNCTGNFFPEEEPLDNTEFVDCNTVFWSAVYMQRDTTISNCSFVRCNKPLLYWPGGSLPADMVILGCTFIDCMGDCISLRDGDASTDTYPMRIVNCTFQNIVGRCIYANLGAPTIGEVNELSVEGCSFTGNTISSGNGAAIHLGGASVEYAAAAINTTVTNCTFTNNSAQSGGAIYTMMNQPLTMIGCTFTGNSATSGSGGATAQEFGGRQQHLATSNCSFVGNTATGDGGAIKLSGWAGAATLAGCTFQSNVAAGYGGAVNVDRTSATVANCQFIDNSSAGQGGGYFQAFGSTNLGSCSFVGNEATLGGALNLYAYNSSVLSSCSFAGNRASNSGGAVLIALNGTSAINGCTFDGNLCAAGGHALRVDGVGTSVTTTACAIRGDVDAPGTFNPAILVTAAASITLASTSVCGSGIPAWSGAVSDAGGNCIVASCADSDNNGTPDECQSVTVPGDYKSVQFAIDATPAGEFRLVSLGSGTFAGPISFGGRNVVVRGAGAGQTIIDGSGGVTTSVVAFTGGEPASSALEGVTIRGGLTGTPLPSLPSALVGGGVFALNSAASLRNCVIELNEAGFGAGIYFRYSTGSIENCIVRNNRASSDGGGIQIYGGSVGVIGSFVENNYTNGRGGGLHLVEGTPSLVQTTVRTNFSNNLAGGVSWVPGGDAQASLEIVDSEVKDNTAAKHKGGIAIVPNGAIATSLSGSVVCGNSPAPNISGPWENLAGNEVCECLGDIIVDGMVGPGDLAVLLGAWGSADLPTGAADVNHDSIVDGGDLVWVLVNWGTCFP